MSEETELTWIAYLSDDEIDRAKRREKVILLRDDNCLGWREVSRELGITSAAAMELYNHAKRRQSRLKPTE